MTSRQIRSVVYPCFLISGAAGLIYEVVWARQLSLFLGITSYAHTAVIAAYMLGLAAGSVVLGRRADRQIDRLRLYALLEIGVGLFAATTPWLFGWIQALYAAIAGGVGITGTGSHLVRFFLALVALLFPTFLMGGTLPILVRGLTTRLPDLAKETGRLYGINTLGATFGTFAAGYLLLPSFGVRRTIFLAVFLNLLVAAVILLLRRHLASQAPQKPKTKKPPAALETAPQAGSALSPKVALLLLIGFAASGFAALVYEIAWIRALTLVIGSSVYAFSTTLTTYLAGLALGSLLYARFLGANAPASKRVRQGAVLEVVVGWTALLGLPLIGQLPGLFLRGYQAGLQESFPLFQAFIFGLCFLIMFIPTLLLGALFPLLTSLWTRDARRVGRGVGTAYAANTGGTILGALFGGLLFVPLLGVHNSLILAAGLHIVVGAAFWTVKDSHDPLLPRLAGPTVAILLFVLIASLVPPWDRALMTSGTFVNAEDLLQGAADRSLREQVQERQFLYYEEGLDGIVAVEQTEDERILVINGKHDASSKTDLPTQVLSGQIPMLIHPNPTTVLVIGLGSGITVGSIATHPSVEQIDVLEISPEVVEAAGFFAPEHGNVLEDPRVDLIVADARNFVLAESQTYDLITCEPSNPWISGISNLFTKDFFELARERLAPGGIMAQWLETYNMSSEDVQTVLRTFQSIFPNVSVWMPMFGDMIMIGTEDRHRVDYVRLLAALGDSSIAEDLARVDIASPSQLFSKFLLGSRDTERYAADGPLNTDDRPRIEFNAPRNLYTNTSLIVLEEILQSLDRPSVEVPIVGMARSTREGLDAPALGLTIEIVGAVTGFEWRPGWAVDRHLSSSAGDSLPQLTVGTRPFVFWRDAEGETQVQASRVTVEPSTEEQTQLLESILGVPPTEAGSVDMPSGAVGQWGLRGGSRPREIVIGITWTARWPEGNLTRYAVTRTQIDPGADSRAAAAIDLAGRLHQTSP